MQAHKSSFWFVGVFALLVVAIVGLVFLTKKNKDTSKNHAAPSKPQTEARPSESIDLPPPTEEEKRAFGIVNDSLSLLAEKSPTTALIHEEFQKYAGIARMLKNNEILMIAMPTSPDFSIFVFFNLLPDDFHGAGLVAQVSCNNSIPLMEVGYVTKKPSVALGLVIAHEMIHVRQCIMRGNVEHAPGTDANHIDELEANNVEDKIFNEFTQGKWDDFLHSQFLKKKEKFGERVDSFTWQYEIEKDVAETFSAWLGELNRFEIGSLLPFYLITLNIKGLNYTASTTNSSVERVKEKQLEFMRGFDQAMNVQRNRL